MTDSKWTREQWEAITEENCDLLVAAGAGAGKTAVLVERIIKKITHPQAPIDIDRLLVVTFTKAAAAEMRERIGLAISQALENNPHSLHLQRQLVLMHQARITTIHSFCLDVLRQNFQLLEIDPNFRIADETETILLKWEALEELFEQIYTEKEKHPLFFDLLESYGGSKDDQPLADLVLDLYNFTQSSPFPQDWLEKVAESFLPNDQKDIGKTPWGAVLLAVMAGELTAMAEMMAKGVEILAGAEGLEKNHSLFQEEHGVIKELQKICLSGAKKSWDALYAGLNDVEYKRLSPAGKKGDPEIHEQAKALRDRAKKKMKRLQENLCPVASSKVWQDFAVLHPLMVYLSKLVIDFTVGYSRRKKRKGLLDFNDLEHLCLEILSHFDGPALVYQEQFIEIYMDEYQDSNLVQELIIRKISRENNRQPNVFMVGDVKQSIYRFRQAKPELFLDKYRRYSPTRGEAYRKILLYKNFRSRQEILAGVNFIFKHIMSKNLGELDYTAEEALTSGALYPEPGGKIRSLGGEKVEVHLLETRFSSQEIMKKSQEEKGQREENREESTEILDKIQGEARLVAEKINKLLPPAEENSPYYIYDRGLPGYRPLAYKDIVILLRTTSQWADVFLEELENQGIPAYADTGTGFFRSVEIQVILSLLQIIDNPQQDIPLLAVLRSPLFSFTSDELSEIRLGSPQDSFFKALEVLAVKNPHPLGQKAAGFLADLARWREKSKYLSTDALIWQLYQDTGYLSLVGGMINGEQRQANLRILFERARQFEATSYKGLFNFINFIDKLKTSQGDLGAAKILGANHNVVRIMSVHKSKGLEFPVVILAGCGKQFNLQDTAKKMLFHHELGLGPDVVDYKLRLAYPSLPKLAIGEKIRRETLAEEMRILYVAMTRAKEKLIITGGVGDINKALDKWADTALGGDNFIPAYRLLEGRNFLDWLMPALFKHQDGAELRNLANISEGSKGVDFSDDSAWQIKIHYQKDLKSINPFSQETEHDFHDWLKESDLETSIGDTVKEIYQKLNWQYPYRDLARFPAKVSVTELKRWFEAEMGEEGQPYPVYPISMVKRPLFMQEKQGLTPSEKGTVWHFVMQHLDFHQEDIEGQIKEMVEKGLLTTKQAAVVEGEKIQRFLLSSLGQRLRGAESIYREVPFFMEIPCRELYPEIKENLCLDEKIILQGVVDCYFQEPGGIVLLDYKTDYLPLGGEEMLKERYRGQISYYARALALLTGERVLAKYIYLLASGKTLKY